MTKRIQERFLLIVATCAVAILAAGCIDTVEKIPFSTGSRLVCRIDAMRCTGCGACVKTCPNNAIVEIQLENRWVCIIDPYACNGCGQCIVTCKDNAINRMAFNNGD